MTVSSSTSKSGPYVGNGSTKIFSYGFRILDEDHLLVTRQLEDGSIETVAPAEYTVDGVGNASGNVTFTTAPASGIKITILRAVPLTQELDLENEGPFLAEDIEAAFDKNLMISQQIVEEQARSIRAPAGDTAASMILPTATERAGRTLIFDATGQPIAGELTTDGVSAIAAQVSADKLAAEAAVTAATVQADAAEDSADAAAAQAAAAAQSLASITDVVLAASPTVATFVGDGVQSSFTLTVEDPPAETCFVYIDGVYQPKAGVYSISGYSLNFISPPANGVDIEVITGGFTTISTTTIGGVTGLQAALDAKLNLTGGTLSGVLRLPDGTVSLPALARSTDPSTGFYFGAARASFSAAGVETMRLDVASMRLGLPAGVTAGGNTPQLQVHDTDADASLATFRWSGDAGGPKLITGKSRSGTMGTMTAVQNNDVVGEWIGYGADGSQMQPAAAIVLRVDGSPGTVDMPGSIDFQTTPDGSATLQHRGRWTNDGVFLIAEATSIAAATVSGVKGRLQLLGDTTNETTAILGRYTADASGPIIMGAKSRNTTVGSHTIVQNGDVALSIVGYGSDGTNFIPVAQISFIVDGTPGTNDMPGSISFRTTADGGSTTTERMTLSAAGILELNSGSVLRLPAGSDVTSSSTGHALQIGVSTSINMRFDNNEIAVFSNGVATTLNLNPDGGTVDCGAAIVAGTTITAGTSASIGTSLAIGTGISNTDGAASFNRSGGTPLGVNRNTNDGNLVAFQRNGSNVGDISVAAGVVDYNAFMGSHWTQMLDPAEEAQLLIGTIVDSVTDLVVWPPEPVMVRFIATEDGTTPTGVQYQKGELVEYQDGWHEPIEDRLPKVEISKTAGSPAVYGVYAHTNPEDGTIHVAALGTYWVRIAAGETPAIGDYIESNGDGCGRVQSDDILRSRTVAKVASLAVREIYHDGSYTIPCTLHCG